MTLPEALELCEYWQSTPPEHETLALFAQVYTTWRPKNARPMTPAEHQKSLEERWAAGAMNVKQMFEAMGGAITAGTTPQQQGPKLTGHQMPGIGPFPGDH